MHRRGQQSGAATRAIVELLERLARSRIGREYEAPIMALIDAFLTAADARSNGRITPTVGHSDGRPAWLYAGLRDDDA